LIETPSARAASPTDKNSFFFIRLFPALCSSLSMNVQLSTNDQE
jgi:hypothetical protein